MEEFYYRYVDKTYASYVDEYDNPSGPSILKVELETYKVIKITPKGVWLARFFGEMSFISTSKRFMLNSSRKRFACPNLEEAKESFIARKEKQASIYYHRYKDAKKAIAMIKGNKSVL